MSGVSLRDIPKNTTVEERIRVTDLVECKIEIELNGTYRQKNSQRMGCTFKLSEI